MNTSSRVGVRVDAVGVHLSEMLEETLDVELEGRRLWSFKPERDGRQDGDGVLVPWPEALLPRLVGTGHVAVRVHLAEEPLFDDSLRFGDSDAPLVVEDDHGNPLTMMKTGRLTRAYENDRGEVVRKVVDAASAAERLILEHTDLTVFLSYGGLLGAVREGQIIGHDNDLDLLVMYPEKYPVDVIQHSYELERVFRREGWHTLRFSAATFKVARHAKHAAGELIDIFAGYTVDGRTIFMPNLPAGPEGLQVEPTKPIMLEGTEFRAPYDTEGWLELIYGPSWRTPDPGWKYVVPPDTRRRTTGWTRSSTQHRNDWSPFYGKQSADQLRGLQHTAFAEWVGSRVEPGRLVDVGCGPGRDSVWFAERGFDVLGLEWVPKALKWANVRAEERGVDATFRRFNVLETHHVLAMGGELAFGEGPCHLYGRHIVDSLPPAGRANLWRLASMATRGGGKAFFEFRTPRPQGARRKDPARLYRQSADDVRRQVEAAGGRVEHMEKASLSSKNDQGEEKNPACRMVTTWR